MKMLFVWLSLNEEIMGYIYHRGLLMWWHWRRRSRDVLLFSPHLLSINNAWFLLSSKVRLATEQDFDDFSYML